jgi:uncharacterized protein
MSREKDPYQARLRRIVRESVWLMSILETVRYCDPPDWLVGGGVLYKLVWNTLHGYTETAHVGDVDVVYFDPEDLGPEREHAVERDLSALRPDIRWDARNQAAVHLWYADKFGYALPPLNSSEDGLQTIPATATAVGVRLLADDDLYDAAPLGPSDFFALVLRRNPPRDTLEVFREWVDEKGFGVRWPMVQVKEEDRAVIP